MNNNEVDGTVINKQTIEKCCKDYFSTILPKVLSRSDDEIIEFMSRYDTKDEWIEKKDVKDYASSKLTEEELIDLSKRAYDVEYMTEILTENISLYVEDINILDNFKNDYNDFINNRLSILKDFNGELALKNIVDSFENNLNSKTEEKIAGEFAKSHEDIFNGALEDFNKKQIESFSLVEEVAEKITGYFKSELLYEGDVEDDKDSFAIFNSPEGDTIAVSYNDLSAVDISSLEHPYEITEIIAEKEQVKNNSKSESKKINKNR
jgi:hypothetical protein